MTKNIDDILKYFILISSFYILLKFTITNFFYTAIYYKDLIIFKKEIIIEKIKFQIIRKLDFASLSFLSLTIFINIIVAAILNYESDTLFDKQYLIKALIATLTSLLLIPSFVSFLNKVCDFKKITNINYKKLIRNQFLANIEIFKNYQIINDFEFIKMKNLSATSKKGIFFLTNYYDKQIKQKIMKENANIILEYQLIWETYCKYLSFVNQANLKYSIKYSSFYLTRIFDTIFIDFFKYWIK